MSIVFVYVKLFAYFLIVVLLLLNSAIFAVNKPINVLK